MRRERSGRLRGSLILILLVALVFVALAAFRAGPAPEISIELALPGIGKRTPIRIVVSEPKRGLKALSVEFVQDERVEILASESYVPIEPWKFWGERTRKDELALEVGSETLEQIQEGPATIRVIVDRASSWLRYPEPIVEELASEVRLRPPTLQALSSFTYVTQGGCEAVVYTVGDSSVQDGVQAGDWLVPGHPLPGSKNGRRFALFVWPYDLEDPNGVRLHASDDLGNQASVPFIDKFSPVFLHCAEAQEEVSAACFDGLDARAAQALPELLDSPRLAGDADELVALTQAPREILERFLVVVRHSSVGVEQHRRNGRLVNAKCLAAGNQPPGLLRHGFDIGSVVQVEDPRRYPTLQR